MLWNDQQGNENNRRGERMVGLEVEVNGVVIGRVTAGAAIDSVLESLVVGDVVVLRAVEVGNVADGRDRSLELKRRARGKGAVGLRHTRLEPGEILRWADAHLARTGQWPTKEGRVTIPEASDGLLWCHTHDSGNIGGYSIEQIKRYANQQDKDRPTARAVS